MATLTELTAEIVSSHAAGTSVSSEDLIKNIQAVYSALKALETGEVVTGVEAAASDVPPAKINFKAYFKKDEIVCLICNKGGFKTLKRHLSQSHGVKPGEYRKQFSIPAKYAFVASSYSEQRRKDALDRGQGEILAKAREARFAKKAVVPGVVAEVAPAPVKKAAAKPAAKAKVAVPKAVKAKAPKVAAKKKAVEKAPVE